MKWDKLFQLNLFFQKTPIHHNIMTITVDWSLEACSRVTLSPLYVVSITPDNRPDEENLP